MSNILVVKTLFRLFRKRLRYTKDILSVRHDDEQWNEVENP